MLRSPVTGRALTPAGHALAAAGERWPVVDGIAFLRADRRALADAALAHPGCGGRGGALVALAGRPGRLGAHAAALRGGAREAVRRRETLSFREAMDLLAFGPVGTYFAHRWSDPTFLSGLALAQAYWGAPRRVLEMACGAGHFLRAFAGHAAEVVGGDLVFAKLWLARHWVAPSATLVCFDAAAPWPFESRAADLLFCHDAFYFLPEKQYVAAEMLRVATRVLVGHMHNALVDNLSAGAPLEPATYAAMFPAPDLFDDRELTAALVEARVPVAGAGRAWRTRRPWRWRSARRARAGGRAADACRRRDARCGATRCTTAGEIRWPSDRYAAGIRPAGDLPGADRGARDSGRRRPGDDALARRRELVDLPERW